MNGDVDYESLIAGVADVRTVVDPGGMYRYVSRAIEREFHWAPPALIGTCEDGLVHPEDLSTLRHARAACIATGSASATYRLRCGNGLYRWVESNATRLEVEGSNLIVSAVRDITERQNHSLALEHQATTDPLTGVANRTVLIDRLHQGLHRLDRSPGVLAVLYLDVDHFKMINDSLGHHIGDALLLKIAERITHHLRPADTLARLGGDEFVIVAEGMSDEAAAMELAHRIIEAGREPFRIGDEEFSCTVSVGVAWCADSQRGAEELLSEADLALYRAKDRGRDRAEMFDEELRTKAVSRVVTERMVRRAVDEDRLVVEYQPIVDMRSGHPVSAEALVRIRDPELGLVPPISFLEVAEETGLLITIDHHVLVDAIGQAARWRTRSEETGLSGVAVNVTARHLADVAFFRTVVDELDSLGVPHASLNIEVTERVLMEASNSAMAGLRSLRDIGVRVGLDDFGTGYSSLTYLQQFPIDFVKIDKLFVDDLEHDDKQRAIISAVIALAHALDLTVVAEGVETTSQATILRDLECDFAQGFLYGSAALPRELDKLVLRGSTRPRATERSGPSAASRR